MSKIGNHGFRCPHCGKIYYTDCYESVNVTLNPELKEKVLDESIFDVTCPYCKEVNREYHPFVYHDMDKKFMIIFDSFDQLMFDKGTFLDNVKEENGIKDAFKNMMSEVMSKVNHIGVDDINDLISIINSYDNDLDYVSVLATLGMMVAFYEEEYKKERGDNFTVRFATLTNYKDSEGDLIVECVANDENGKDCGFKCPFLMDGYDYFKNAGKGKLDKLNLYYVSSSQTDYYVTLFESNHEKSMVNVYYLKTFDNMPIVSMASKFMDGEVKVNDDVIVEYSNGYRYLAKVMRIDSTDEHSFPVDINKLPIFYSYHNDNHFIEPLRDNDVNNEWLVKNLLNEETIKNGFVLNCDVADKFSNSLFYVTYKKNETSYFDEECEILFNQKFESGYKNIKINSLTKNEFEGGIFLSIFTDLDEIKDDTLDYLTMGFNSLVRVCTNDARYSGIILNPNNKEHNLILDLGFLKNYLIYDTISNKEKFDAFIKELSVDDKEKIGKLPIEFMKDIYIEKMAISEMASKYGFEENQFEDLSYQFKVLFGNCLFKYR